MRLFLSLLVTGCFMAGTALAQDTDEDSAPDVETEAVNESSAEPFTDLQEEKPPVEAVKPKPKPASAAKPKPKETPKPAVEAPSPIVKTTPDYVMLRVGSQDIPASEVKHAWDGLFPKDAASDFETVEPEMRDRVLRGVMAERILWQEALKQGIDKSEPVQRDLEDIKRKLVVKALLDAKTTDIGEKELQSAYSDLALSLKDAKEIRARHILVNSEKEAKDVQKSLESGKSFEDVARDYSKDPVSAKQGGDLGYFTKDKMVKEFGDAAFELKKGAISAPVKTAFGWHIIKVEDVRPVTVPTFNDAKDDLKAQLQDRRLSDYVRTLVRQTDVKLYDAKGKELPFNKDVSQDLGEGVKP